MIAPAIKEALKEHKTIQVNLQSICKEIKVSSNCDKNAANDLSKKVEEILLDVVKASNLDLK